jgi:hypothetical protein
MFLLLFLYLTLYMFYVTKYFSFVLKQIAFKRTISLNNFFPCRSTTEVGWDCLVPTVGHLQLHYGGEMVKGNQFVTHAVSTTSYIRYDLELSRGECCDNIIWFNPAIFMVFNATFNNVSVILWRSVLLMESLTNFTT